MRLQAKPALPPRRKGPFRSEKGFRRFLRPRIQTKRVPRGVPRGLCPRGQSVRVTSFVQTQCQTKAFVEPGQCPNLFFAPLSHSRVAVTARSSIYWYFHVVFLSVRHPHTNIPNRQEVSAGGFNTQPLHDKSIVTTGPKLNEADLRHSYSVGGFLIILF